MLARSFPLIQLVLWWFCYGLLRAALRDAKAYADSLHTAPPTWKDWAGVILLFVGGAFLPLTLGTILFRFLITAWL